MKGVDTTTDMEKIIEEKLNAFLAERQGRFPNVTEQQKARWKKEVTRYIMSLLDDNDTFYGTIPNGVEIDETKY